MDIKSQQALSVENLTIKFGNHTALENINFDLPAGDFLAIVGPNGSGKTTLIKSILGINNVSKGKIKIFGSGVNDSGPGTIGYVPQFKSLDRSFPARAIDLVASGLANTWPGRISGKLKDRSLQALEEVDAAKIWKRQLNSLSGGELQRVYLARGIVRNPKILMLDEPETGVDMVCETALNHLIDRINQEKGTTIVMVTHNWATAFHHARTALLINKYQISFGPSEKALHQNELQKAFVHIGSFPHLAEHNHE